MSKNSKLQTKKYRTDLLIKEQFEYLNQLEAKLKENVEFVAKNVNLIQLFQARAKGLRDAVAFLMDLEEINAEDKCYDDILKLYRVNLIRCDLIRKLDIELTYARAVLTKAIAKQKDLQQARERVEWLENEIEKIIRSNKDIDFPLRKSLELDSLLRVEKKSIFDDLKMTPFEEDEPTSIERSTVEDSKEIINDQAKKNNEVEQKPKETKDEIIQLEFKWDKKSTGSTDSLLESDSETPEKDATPSPKEQMSQRESMNAQKSKENEDENHDQVEILRDIKNKSESLETNILKSELENNVNNEIQINGIKMDNEDDQEYKEIDSNGTALSVRKESQAFFSENPPSTILDRSNSQISFKTKTPKPESEIDTGQKYPSWQKIHSRFEIPSYSRKLIFQDPTSYHSLGLALTESQIDTEGLVDGNLDMVTRKKYIDINDSDFLKLASFIQSVSKRVCSETHEFSYGKTTNVDRYGRLTQISNYETRSVESRSGLKRNKVMVYPSTTLLPPTPLALTRPNKSQYFPRSASAFVSKGRPGTESSGSLENYKPSFFVNQHNLREQTKLVLYHRPKKPATVSNEFDISNNEKKIFNKSRIPPLVSWSEIRPNSSPVYHTGPKFERIKVMLDFHF